MDKLKFFLQIKTWKLFCLYISLFVFGWISFFENFIAPVIIIIWFTWIVSIGYNGQDFLNGLTPNWLTKTKFKIRVLILISLIVFSPFLPDQTMLDTNPLFLIIIIPITLVGLYCFYYIFIATTVVISTMEHRRKPEFWSSFGHFFRLIVFPLGVVGIQPILNKEFEKLY